MFSTSRLLRRCSKLRNRDAPTHPQLLNEGWGIALRPSEAVHAASALVTCSAKSSSGRAPSNWTCSLITMVGTALMS